MTTLSDFGMIRSFTSAYSVDPPPRAIPLSVQHTHRQRKTKRSAAIARVSHSVVHIHQSVGELQVRVKDLHDADGYALLW